MTTNTKKKYLVFNQEFLADIIEVPFTHSFEAFTDILCDQLFLLPQRFMTNVAICLIGGKGTWLNICRYLLICGRWNYSKEGPRIRLEKRDQKW